jgi:hypothetical protein
MYTIMRYGLVVLIFVYKVMLHIVYSVTFCFFWVCIILSISFYC